MATSNASKVIIVGAGMSGISAAKRLFDLGVTDILILEATNHIGGRMRSTRFADLNVEMGANWVEGVNGKEVNPIWEMAENVGLRTFRSDYSNLSSNTYGQNGKKHDQKDVDEVMNDAEETYKSAEEYSKKLPCSGHKDISIKSFQRLEKRIPSSEVEMAVDYYNYDYEFAEPPRVTSLQSTVPLPTFANYGDDVYFVADQRGYEYLVYKMATEFLETDEEDNIVDPRLHLGQVVINIDYSEEETATVSTDDGSVYKADFVLVSVSLGVLQSDLINFHPALPDDKAQALAEFDMAVYTKIFLKFPYKFWPDGDGSQFFLYASERRGYYPLWQQFEKEYPGANVLMVTVTDDESKRIEKQDDSETKKEAMEVLRKIFGEDIPEAEYILTYLKSQGISAAKRLFDLGVTDILILEATSHIGGRMRSTSFAGLNVEMGANWETYKSAEEFSKKLPCSGYKDISIKSFQRLEKKIPSSEVEMAVDYFNYDYEFAEPPRVTSLQSTVPLPTFADYGDDIYFVADKRGYEYLVYKMATEFLETDEDNNIVDPRLHLGEVVINIDYSEEETATVSTDDGSVYKADFVLVSVNLGVLQSDLINFDPALPDDKAQALAEFDMAVYTKIFLKFPSKFWPDKEIKEKSQFFLYASERRGYYPFWQQFEEEYRKPMF
ncbi:hypothetical protein Cni_G27417 [Canna indica]|uniref:Amine oxidase domain-containing protein n=1 Tax=Canna indica TaxID=4628 RepID=A0AAQ3L1L5_9LILI|nr:hypothetical protein Cni_G27417 [Canna indica]